MALNPASIWVIDDDKTMRWVLKKTLTEAGMQVTTFEESDSALAQLKQAQHQNDDSQTGIFPDVILTDIRMPGTDGLTFLGHVHADFPAIPVIIMTAHSDLESAVSSYQTGAFEYLPKPFDIDDAVHLVNRAIIHAEQKKQQQAPHLNALKTIKQLDIIGESPAMQEVFRAIGRLSHSNITVLINGESGTGKELVAQALHRHSPRANKRFIALNMAAIPHDLIENELFGHEKGAFTGANTQRQGRFEQANGGTLFLDEIGDMPFDTQTRLLRVLADGEFYRIGGHLPVKVDVRIIAATHQHLEKLVQAGKFREDLFHRLNVIRIHIPRLRERHEDIPKLAAFFLARAAQELKAPAKILRPETVSLIQQLPWLGNVRQLENFARWVTVMASGREIYPADLPAEMQAELIQLGLMSAMGTTHLAYIAPIAPSAAALNATLPAPEQKGPVSKETRDTPTLPPDQWVQLLLNWAREQLAAGHTDLLGTALPIFERHIIQAALEHTQGHKKLAAEYLGWGRNTLTRKMQELHLPNVTEGSND